MTNSAKAILRLCRPKQWTKGFLVFGAILFARGYGDPAKWIASFEAFFAIAFLSSAVYVVNDLLDVERDRNHPVKRNRPIASGLVSPAGAFITILVLVVFTVGLSLFLPKAVWGILGAYLLVQLAYNGYLKHQPVADVFCLSTGFVLRAVLGAAAISAPISGWLLFCTGALAMMLGFGKRRSEFILQGEDRTKSRESLRSYTTPVLDAFLLFSAASAGMSYGIYSIDSPTAQKSPALILTVPFVFYGIYRYLFVALTTNEGGEPESLVFSDRHLVASLLLFLVSAGLALSGLSFPFLEPPR